MGGIPNASIDLYWLPLGAGGTSFGSTVASTKPSAHTANIARPTGA